LTAVVAAIVITLRFTAAVAAGTIIVVILA
jgi:hypothetical protein